MGYTTEEVPINNRTRINLALVPDVQSLSEVMVVGYGTQKKSDLTGSVASVSSEELIAYPAAGAVQALQGRAAGVQTQSNNGEPGAPKISINTSYSLQEEINRLDLLNASQYTDYIQDIDLISLPTDSIPTGRILFSGRATSKTINFRWPEATKA